MLFRKRVNKSFPSSDANIAAYVMERGGSVYFYVIGYEGKEDQQFAAMAWLFNTRKAPGVLNQQLVEKGKQPRLPADCSVAVDVKAFSAAAYSVKWHDGNIISLTAGGRVLSVITEYHLAEYKPYSRFCSKSTEYAFPLSGLPADIKEKLAGEGLVF